MKSKDLYSKKGWLNPIFLFFTLTSFLILTSGCAEDKGFVEADSSQTSGQVSEISFQEAVYAVDPDYDGQITDEEWNDRICDLSEEDLSDKFKEFDINGNQEIDISEWKLDTSIFERLDSDNSLSLSLEEFMEFSPKGSIKGNKENRPGKNPAEIFAALDSDSDGNLTSDEWKKNMDHFYEIDSDKNGLVSLEEFESFLPPKNQNHVRSQKKSRSEKFAELDVNSDGIIDTSEWQGKSEHFAEMDTDENGSISLAEFEVFTPKKEKGGKGKGTPKKEKGEMRNNHNN